MINKEENIKKEIERLRKDIEECNINYFENSQSLISDYEYDCLLEELSKLEEEYPQFKTEDSPTNILGEKNSNNFEKIVHKIPMLSLKKTYSFEDIDAFFKTLEIIKEPITYVCELKLDGVSIDAHYIDGILRNLSTRGDGKIGDNVIKNKDFITNLPSKIDNRFKDVHFRGEVLMKSKDFEDYNNEVKKNNVKNSKDNILANPRNATSGTLKTLNNDEILKNRKLTVFFYNIIFENNDDNNKNLINSQLENLKIIEELKLPFCEKYKYCKDKNEVFEYINYVENIKNTLEFPIDGVVIKVNELKYYEQLGCTNKNPRWAIAYKYKPEAISTRLLNIEFTVGRSGIITPIANFEPIKLAGTIVKRATLHNESVINRLGLRENDKVLVKKSGEIIPKIIGVDIVDRDFESKKIEFIKNCPICNSELIKKGDLYYCNNIECQGRIIESLSHFVSKNALNIKSIGQKAIKLFVERGLVKNIADIYLIKYRDLVRLPGFSALSAQNTISEINESKKQPLHKFLFGLGIDGVGEVVSANIMNKFETFENLINSNIEDFNDIKLVGTETAKNIVDYFKNEQNLKIFNKLLNIL